MRGKTFLTSLITIMFSITACAQSSTSLASQRSNTVLGNASDGRIQVVNTQTTEQLHKDGTLISIKRIYNSDLESDMYDMFYYSNGVKVEAYVELPKHKGTYPLFVGLHGGAPIRYPQDVHIGSPYAVTTDQISEHTGIAIYIYPEYQGYLNSGGFVHGIKGNASDVINGVAALRSLAGFKVNGIYLFGVSMGGGVALLAASELSNVKAVVANSPFVGLDEFDKWYEKLGGPKNPFWHEWYLDSTRLYGFNYSSQEYTVRSIVAHISTISAPVLLLQGTSDQRVIWQTVQELANRMKQQHKTVQLILYKGGQHGLANTGSLWNESTDATQAWFSKYRFPESYLNGAIY